MPRTAPSLCKLLQHTFLVSSMCEKCDRVTLLMLHVGVMFTPTSSPPKPARTSSAGHRLSFSSGR